MAIFCSLQTVELSECNLLRGTFRSTSSATNHKLFLGCQILSGLVFILIFRAPKIGREKIDDLVIGFSSRSFEIKPALRTSVQRTWSPPSLHGHTWHSKRAEIAASRQGPAQSVFHSYLFSAEKLRTPMDMSRAIPNRLENPRLTQFGSTCHG